MRPKNDAEGPKNHKPPPKSEENWSLRTELAWLDAVLTTYPTQYGAMTRGGVQPDRAAFLKRYLEGLELRWSEFMSHRPMTRDVKEVIRGHVERRMRELEGR